MKPFVSVIVPCRNEARFLDRCLDSILTASYPASRMEVLVVDGGSTDGSRSIIRSRSAHDSRVRLVDNPDGHTPAALNHGIRAARGEIIARVDAHAAVSANYFERCTNYLESGEADCAGGVMRTLPRDGGWFAAPIAAVLSHPFGVGNSHFRVGVQEPRLVDTVYGGCWRREVFERIGYFHPALERSQDMEFSLRLKAAGGKTLLVPEVSIDYYARSHLGEFWKHNFRNGEWAILPFVYSRVVPVSVRHLIPFLFVAGLAAGIALLPWIGWPLAAVTAPYVALHLAASVGVAARSRRWRDRALMPVVFLSLHLGYGFGSVWGMFRACRLLAFRPVHSKESPCPQRP